MSRKTKAKPSPEIYESEWRALLEKTMPKPPPGGKTMREFAKKWGVSMRGAWLRFDRWGLRELTRQVRVGNKVYYVPRGGA